MRRGSDHVGISLQLVAGSGRRRGDRGLYGTLGLLALLSAMGITIVIHGGAWATVIAAFATLAAVGVALGSRRHGSFGPLVLAVVGAALVIWTQFGVYNAIVEGAGFAALVAAVFWDRRARRTEPTTAPLAEGERTGA